MNHQNEHNNSPHQDLLHLLAQCADECDHCFDECLDNDRTDELVRALRACRDCAKVCRVTSSFVASNSIFSQRMVDLCAEICQQCADVCQNHQDQEQECKHCAKICRECAEACRNYKGVGA
ncbi:four-helix bundle copper-binding protein [Pontibacter rugosus]|uniref:Four-helix bundle copper-binding protein n=1 Tax=Pontibacter rugosus TaxID=1745966 RepID=A0ABW3SQN8_9BACT